MEDPDPIDPTELIFNANIGTEDCRVLAIEEINAIDKRQ